MKNSSKGFLKFIAAAEARKKFNNFIGQRPNIQKLKSSLIEPICVRSATFINDGVTQFKTLLANNIPVPRWTLNDFIVKYRLSTGLNRGALRKVMLDTWTKKLPATETRYCFDVNYDLNNREFKVPSLPAAVIGLCYDETMLFGEGELTIPAKIGPLNPKEVLSQKLYLVTDASNFYVGSGGQQSDQGELHFRFTDNQIDENWRIKLNVVDVLKMNDCVVHVCQLPGQLYYKPIRLENLLKNAEIDGVEYDEEELSRHLELKTDLEIAKVDKEVEAVTLKIGEICCCQVNSLRRKLNSCHHTAIHLLNGALRMKPHPIVHEVQSATSMDNGYLEVIMMGQMLTKDDVALTEKMIKKLISTGANVIVKEVGPMELIGNQQMILKPREAFTEKNVRLVEIKCPTLAFNTQEPCCGTHVMNINELQEFCITDFKKTGLMSYRFTFAANLKAKEILKNKVTVKQRLCLLEKAIKNDRLSSTLILQMKQLCKDVTHNKIIVPYIFKLRFIEKIELLLLQCKKSPITFKFFVRPYKPNPLSRLLRPKMDALFKKIKKTAE